MLTVIIYICQKTQHEGRSNNSSGYSALGPRFPGILPGPATTQKVYQGIEWISQLARLQ